MADTPLNYAAATPTESVTWHGRELRIELGPMSTGTFVTSIIPVSVWLVASVALLVLAMLGRPSSGGLFILAMIAFGAVMTLINLSRHRNAPRRVWASNQTIGYSNAYSSGLAQVFPSSDYYHSYVVRSVWRPWLFHLTVNPRVSPFLPTNKKRVILLIDTNRPRLKEFAKLIETARLPDPQAHVRGAFEVLPLTKPPGSGSLHEM